MAGDRVGAVNGLITFWGEEIRLRQLRPTGEKFSLAAVQFTNLLQTHNIGIQLLNGMAQVVNFQPTLRPNPLHTLVNVVGGHTQNVHDPDSTTARWDNIKIASALEGEKQACAACW